MKLDLYLSPSTYWIDFNLKPETLRLGENRNVLHDKSIEEDFLNRIPSAQEVWPTTEKKYLKTKNLLPRYRKKKQLGEKKAQSGRASLLALHLTDG